MAWRVTEGLLHLMRDECTRMHTPFAIVTLTAGNQVTPVPEEKEEVLRRLGVSDLYYPERRLSELGRREGVPVLNLAPPMAKQAEEQHIYFHSEGGQLGIGHWSEAGHAAAGELIASWLARRLADSSLVPTPR